MKCGNCKGNHEHVSDVKACYAGAKVADIKAPSAWDAMDKAPEPVCEAPKPAVSALKREMVPAGRYAIKDAGGAFRFYRVDRPTEGRWKGYVFVKAQGGDETYPILNPDRRKEILAEIAIDPKTASVAYGRELGVCGVCGRTLTDPDSIAAGIGPICAEKKGW